MTLDSLSYWEIAAMRWTPAEVAEMSTADLTTIMSVSHARTSGERPAELADRVAGALRPLGVARELAYRRAGLERPRPDADHFSSERYAEDNNVRYYGAYGETLVDGSMLGRSALLMPLEYAHIGRPGGHYRLGVVHYPHTGHARVSFSHPEIGATSTLRARGKRVLERVLGESSNSIRISGGMNGSGCYIVQGWSETFVRPSRFYPPAGAIL